MAAASTATGSARIFRPLRLRVRRVPMVVVGRTAVSAIGIAVVIHSVNIGAALAAVADASPVLLALAVIAAVGWQAATYAQWLLLLPRGTSRPHGPVRLFLKASLASLVIPGGVGGDALRTREVGRVVGYGPVLAATIGARLLTLVAASTWTLLGSLLLIDFLGDAAPAVAVGALLVALVGGFLFLHVERVWTGRRWKRRVSRFREEFLSSLASYRHTSLLLRVFTVASIAWALNIASLAWFSSALGAHAGLPLLTVGVAVSAAIAALPITINGFGLREGALIALLVKGGVPITTATALTVFLDIQLVPLALVGAGAWLFRSRSLSRPSTAALR